MRISGHFRLSFILRIVTEMLRSSSFWQQRIGIYFYQMQEHLCLEPILEKMRRKVDLFGKAYLFNHCSFCFWDSFCFTCIDIILQLIILQNKAQISRTIKKQNKTKKLTIPESIVWQSGICKSPLDQRSIYNVSFLIIPMNLFYFVKFIWGVSCIELTEYHKH